MAKHRRDRARHVGGQISHRDAFASQQIGPFSVNRAEHSITLDITKIEGPDRVYDADVAWIEHKPGAATLVFAKLGGDRDQLRSRLEIRYPPEDLLLTFWGNSRSFFSRVKRYVAGWDDESRTTHEPPVKSNALQTHSEWSSFTYMSQSGSESAIDFYHVAPGALARFAQHGETAGLKMRPVVRVQLTTFELLSFILRVQVVLDEIRKHIPAAHEAARQVPTAFDDDRAAEAAQEHNREYGS